MKRYILIIILLVAIGSTSYGFTWQDLWLRKDQQAMNLLKKGDAKEAANTFESPSWKAVANYKAKNYDEAIKEFAGQNTVDGKYNLGNALALQGKYEEAIKAYDETLKLKPDLHHAVYNRALIKKLLNQQQQQQKKDPQKSKDKDKNKDNSQDPNKQNPGKQDKQQNSDHQNKDNKNSSQNNQSTGDQPKNKSDKQDQDNSNGDQANNQKNSDKNKSQKDSPEKPEGQPPNKQPKNNDQENSSAQQSSNSPEQSQQQKENLTQNQSKNKPVEQKGDQLGKKNNQIYGSEQQDTAGNLNKAPAAQQLSIQDQQRQREQIAKQKLLDEDTDQWLEQIPDDPSGLLRKKIMRDHLKMTNQAQEDW